MARAPTSNGYHFGHASCLDLRGSAGHWRA